jgi:hypothetical protein
MYSCKRIEYNSKGCASCVVFKAYDNNNDDNVLQKVHENKGLDTTNLSPVLSI